MATKKKVPARAFQLPLPSKPAVPSIVFSCIPFAQGPHEMAVFECKAKVLYQFVKINRREEKKDVGYQRALAMARVNEIARYVERSHALPTGIVLALDEDSSVDLTKKTLTIPNRPDAGWVIDGQHRLAGANRASKDIHVPVIAFLKLSLEGQVEQFVTINQKQKGVPSSLYYELLPMLPGSKSEREVLQLAAMDLAKALTSDEESPFFNKIVSTTAPRRGQLSLTNAIRKLAPHVKMTAALVHYAFDERKTIINNYYKALCNAFPEEYKSEESLFFRTLGFGALMNALPSFVHNAVSLYRGLRVVDFQKLFEQISDFDFAQYHGHGTGSAAENELATELVARLSNAVSKDAVPSRIRM
jgi:DGQHR domain-containing protein